MRIFLILLGIILSWNLWLSWVLAITSDDINIRQTSLATQWWSNGTLDTFVWPFREFFFSPELRDESVINTFISLAFAIKNFFIAVAVIFLVIGVLKLLFSWGDEEAVKKWRRNIIWISVWIFVMQIASSLWRLLYITDPTKRIDGRLGWQFWTNIFEPIVNVMILLAGFWFILMMVYAFYIIVTGGGDEEKLKKWKNIVIYSVIGFLLIRIPRAFVTAIYGEPTDACKDTSLFTIGNCMMGEKKLEGTISIFGKVLTYVNGFLMVLCTILIIYAGWLVLISWGDEEKLKKAKNTLIYILFGVVILVASHAIFRFFILKG